MLIVSHQRGKPITMSLAQSWQIPDVVFVQWKSFLDNRKQFFFFKPLCILYIKLSSGENGHFDCELDWMITWGCKSQMTVVTELWVPLQYHVLPLPPNSITICVEHLTHQRIWPFQCTVADSTIHSQNNPCTHAHTPTHTYSMIFTQRKFDWGTGTDSKICIKRWASLNDICNNNGNNCMEDHFRYRDQHMRVIFQLCSLSKKFLIWLCMYQCRSKVLFGGVYSFGEAQKGFLVYCLWLC